MLLESQIGIRIDNIQTSIAPHTTPSNNLERQILGISSLTQGFLEGLHPIALLIYAFDKLE